MKNISSRDNPDYRRLLRAAAGKRAPGDRSKAAQDIVLEGVHLCESWLAHLGQPELAFFDSERLEHPDIDSLMESVDASRVRLCSPALIHAASQVVQGQGVIFLSQAPQPQVPARLTRNCLWLDRVQDPGNMGTMLRTAAAAGMREIYTARGSVAAWSPKVLRSAQGAHFVLDIHEGLDLNMLLDRLEIPLLVTSLDESRNLYESDLPAQAAWVFGNEGQGVAPALQDAATLRLRIPHHAGVESLNVAVAAGICLFEQQRQISKRCVAPGQSGS